MARRYSTRNYSAGHEAAKKHIEEARILSEKLGGTDEDVKRYLFSLKNSELKSVLLEYKRKYGDSAYDYATKTIHKWKSHKVHMSGTVASRIYNLLPSRMPLQDKYKLVETLWKKYCPKSHKIIIVGKEATKDEIISIVNDHLLSTINEYEIPTPLINRFQWLSMGDVKLKEQLLNHFLGIEKKQAVEFTKLKLPVLLKHFNQNENIHHLSETIQIGNHILEMKIDSNFSGVTLENPGYYTKHKSNSGGGTGWIWFVIIIIFLIMAAGG
jgi:hypothetical protein